MKLLLPLRDFSPSGNLELKYMLRGVEAYLQEPPTIHIISKQLPKWITDVNHIQCTDSQNKEYSVCHKLMTAMTLLEGEDFLCMDDDHFLLEPLNNIPYYYKGTIQEAIISRKKDNSYRITMENTLKILTDWNRPVKNFDMHCPIVFDKNWFIKIMTSVNWNKPYGFGIRSLYCNMLNMEGEFMEDCKIDKALSTFEIAEKIYHRKFFSTADSAVNDDMKLMLDMLYPSPSKYEK